MTHTHKNKQHTIKQQLQTNHTTLKQTQTREHHNLNI